jgi:hypothetical protein
LIPPIKLADIKAIPIQKRVNRNLRLIYEELGIQDDPNVLEAHREIQVLIDTLAKKCPFKKMYSNQWVEV